MGFDELIAHIVLDSICRTTELPQIDSFMQARTSWDDTLKTLHKYMTILVDKDPLTVFGITNALCEWRISFPVDVRNALAREVVKRSPVPSLDIPIATCDYILTISVTDTSKLTDTSAISARTATITTGTITSTILGHALPQCALPQQSLASSSSNDCITFDSRKEQIEYHLFEGLQPTDNVTVDKMIPKPNRQYLVFLKLTTLCRDTNNVNFTVLPAYWVGPRCGIYEIIANRIEDPTNYFGLGPNPLAADVTAALTARVQAVKTWVP